tara:strand:+ start:714 stop:995 length:282 start_codon:yes stop_codon:yes gene_type:complete
MSLVVYDLLREISQYAIGNTSGETLTTKNLKSRFNSLNFKELTNFLCSCDAQISVIQENPCLSPEAKKEDCMLVLKLYKIAKPIASKKMRCQF